VVVNIVYNFLLALLNKRNSNLGEYYTFINILKKLYNSTFYSIRVYYKDISVL